MEVWKDIADYQGIYQVSNLGRVRVLDRQIKTKKKGVFKTQKGKVLNLNIKPNGYVYVTLTKNKKAKTFRVHRLVMLSFIGCSDLSIDHLNGCKTDNRLNNLEYVTIRENIIRASKKRSSTSLYNGVYKYKGKWKADIKINGERYFLGTFDNELEAAQAVANLETSKGVFRIGL